MWLLVHFFSTTEIKSKDELKNFPLVNRPMNTIGQVVYKGQEKGKSMCRINIKDRWTPSHLDTLIKTGYWTLTFTFVY